MALVIRLSATDLDQLTYTGFDLVMLKGVSHHLSDEEIGECPRKISLKLSASEIFVTLDFTLKNSRFLANFLVLLDGGWYRSVLRQKFRKLRKIIWKFSAVKLLCKSPLTKGCS